VTDLRPELTRLATNLGAEVRWVTVPSAPQYRYVDDFTLVVDAVNIAVSARTGGKGALLGAAFTVEASVPLTSGAVTMRRENWIDRLGKNLFINREFQFGDESFDAAVYIETDVPDEELQRLLRPYGVRAAIASLVGGIADEVTFAAPRIDVTKTKLVDPSRTQRSISVAVPVKKFGDREAVVALTQTLVRLAKEVEVERARDRHPIALEAAPKRFLGALVTMLAAFCTWIAAFVLVIVTGPPTIGWRAYERGLSAGVALWLGIIALAIVIFRGRSTSFRIVITLAILWLGLLPASGKIAERVNAELDHAPRTSAVGAAYLRYGKGSPRKHVNVLGTDLVVSDDVVNRSLQLSSSPSRARVVLGEGVLGSKWIASVDPP
jgi:hypothetical protein